MFLYVLWELTIDNQLGVNVPGHLVKTLEQVICGKKSYASSKTFSVCIVSFCLWPDSTGVPK